MKRRLIQGLLVVALLCGAVLLAHPTAAWADVTATAPTQGDGSTENPYQISTEEELYWFAGLVNDGDGDACAVLTKNITINPGLDQTKFAVNSDGVLTYDGDTNISFTQWTPIGSNYDNRYTGTFDGKGHTIKGLYINSDAGYAGLFGYIGEGGSVQNLTLADSVIRISRSKINTFVGGICGYNLGSITNCHNSGIVNVNGGASTYVGGICGRNNGSSITNCSNSGDVTVTGTVGGICGQNWRSIENCSNSGDVTGSSDVGGICGQNGSSGSITTCSNSGAVGGGSNVGGICGDNDGSITNCSNSGDVTGSYVGGICGLNDGGSIENCSNSGDVTGSGSSVGGICGYNNRGSITTCSNSGEVTGSGNYVGGICGVNRVGRIMNCSNSGEVSGSGVNTYVGGICGENNDGSITSCSNSGDVSDSGSGFSSDVGGICGENRGGIENCSNSGDVSDSGFNSEVGGGSYVGGICGYSDSSRITVCYWLSGTADAGIGGGMGTGEAFEKTEDEYKSGEVAWLLNQWQDDDLKLNGKVWAVGADGYPVLNGKNDNIVVKLTFDTNTGKEEEQPIIRYGNVGDALPKVTLPEITGYTFAGWYDNEALSGEPVTEISAEATGDKTYYAKWTANVYTVTLNTNNGTINSGNITSYTYGIGATLPTDVTRSGYTFGGWYDNDALSGDPVTAISADATGDQTYWAKWTAKQTPPPTNPPTVSEETIDAIQDAQPGETVTVDLSSGDTKLDKEVFEELAGKDVTLVVDLGDGVSWTVNGTDIPEDADFTDIDMGVTMNSDGIPVDVVNAITGEHGSVQVELAHNGAFGFTMTLTAPLGAENAGYWANLYHFNEEADEMTFETAAQIGNDGSVSLAFSHASQYAIVIDDHNHGVVTLPFTDVSDSDWFYNPVVYVYSQGLMTGTSDTTFEPNTPLSRAMLVAVLHRLEGSPAASAGDFTDVADGDWYAQAVNWAASVGVVNGFDDGTFQPNTAITREQLAAILRNYAAYKGLDVSTSGDLSTYTDADSVSDWAKESVTWAVGEGLLSGMTIDTLQPQGVSTRAQVAAVLQRYLDFVTE